MAGSLIDPKYIRIRMSNLRVLSAYPGSPLRVSVDVTNIDQSPFQEVVQQTRPLGGLVTLSGTVVDLLGKQNVTTYSVQAFGGGLGLSLKPGESGSLTLTTMGPLAQRLAGSAVAVYVGDQAYFNTYTLGDAFAPDPSAMLSTTATVAGQQNPVGGGGSGGGGVSGGGGSSGGGVSGGTGGGGGGGGTPVNLTPTPSGPSTKTILYVAGGAVAAGGLGWLLLGRRR